MYHTCRTFSCNSSAPDTPPTSSDPAEAAADCALCAAETLPLMVFSALAFFSPSRNETLARETEEINGLFRPIAVAHPIPLNYDVILDQTEYRLKVEYSRKDSLDNLDFRGTGSGFPLNYVPNFTS